MRPSPIGTAVAGQASQWYPKGLMVFPVQAVQPVRFELGSWPAAQASHVLRSALTNLGNAQRMHSPEVEKSSVLAV
jgi:hypothetical protein